MARRSGLMVLGFVVPLAAGALAACGDDGAQRTSGNAAPELDAAGQRGRELARTRGCAACHGADGKGGLGPAWTGLLGSEVKLTDGSTAHVDEAYIERSIKDPGAQVVEGYSVTMPKTNLTDDEVADLVAYIVALNR